jgi:uncharacterized short protein YbdD (DUF466 family)
LTIVDGVREWSVTAARGVRWWVTSLMGDHAYDGYLAHQRATHPDDRPLDVSEFWAERYREQDANPGSRCC